MKMPVSKKFLMTGGRARLGLRLFGVSTFATRLRSLRHGGLRQSGAGEVYAGAVSHAPWW